MYWCTVDEASSMLNFLSVFSPNTPSLRHFSLIIFTTHSLAKKDRSYRSHTFRKESNLAIQNPGSPIHYQPSIIRMSTWLSLSSQKCLSRNCHQNMKLNDCMTWLPLLWSMSFVPFLPPLYQLCFFIYLFCSYLSSHPKINVSIIQLSLSLHFYF